MKYKMICVCLLCLLTACTKTAQKKAVPTTFSGTVYHKYYNKPIKNTEVTIAYDEFVPDNNGLLSGSWLAHNIGTTYTDDNGNFSFTFNYEAKYTDIEISIPEFSFTEMNIHKGANHFDFKLYKLPVVKTAVYFYNNKYPLMALSVNGKVYNPLSDIWAKPSGYIVFYEKHIYEVPYVLKYTNAMNKDGVLHEIPLGNFADTISVCDTINMDF